MLRRSSEALLVLAQRAMRSGACTAPLHHLWCSSHHGRVEDLVTLVDTSAFKFRAFRAAFSRLHNAISYGPSMHFLVEFPLSFSSIANLNAYTPSASHAKRSKPLQQCTMYYMCHGLLRSRCHMPRVCFRTWLGRITPAFFIPPAVAYSLSVVTGLSKQLDARETAKTFTKFHHTPTI